MISIALTSVTLNHFNELATEMWTLVESET